MNLKMNLLGKWTRGLWIVCLLLLSACSSEGEKFIGTIHTIDTENKRILVVSQLQKEDIHEDYKKLIESGEYSQAIWVSKVNPRKYKIGEEIEVLYEGSDDSFPAQVTAKKIDKLK
ncbi:DUF3221 domain-containing protein [Paenibacillus sp. FSL R10-2734]|uniref:DUF3221 domain-containing protein n=1 Tax=Paenibacillus sp. FSL R10-2734 TaxID=2954691 RepID=UPI0030D9CA76